MAKARSKTVFVCQECGSSQPKWMGRCPDCGEWNTLVETIVERDRRAPWSSQAALPGVGAKPQRLLDVGADGMMRIPLGMTEFSRVLGGGIVPGSLVLVGVPLL